MSIATTIIPTWQSQSNRMRQWPLLPTTSKPTAKVTKSKERCQQTSQQSLHPQGNPCSPVENNTNLHIASINLSRDRFDNVLMALGGASPSKNITPPDSPTDPLDESVDLLPLPMPNYDELTEEEPQDHGRSTVWINNTPTSQPPNASPRVEQGSFPPPITRRCATTPPTTTNSKEQQDEPANIARGIATSQGHQRTGGQHHT
jgi:hypothetical protein